MINLYGHGSEGSLFGGFRPKACPFYDYRAKTSISKKEL